MDNTTSACRGPTAGATAPDRTDFGALTGWVPPPHLLCWEFTTLCLLGTLGIVVILVAATSVTRRFASLRGLLVAGEFAWITRVVLQASFGVRVGLPQEDEGHL